MEKQNYNHIRKGTVLKLHGYVLGLSVRAQVEKVIPLDNDVEYVTTIHDGPKKMRGTLSFLESQVKITGKIVTLSSGGSA